MRDGHLASDEVPQADTIDTVFRVVELIADGSGISPEGLHVGERNVAYYVRAARELRLLDEQHDLTSAGRRIASLRGAERLGLAAVQFEKSRCGVAWARWSGKSSLGDVAPESAERFLRATTDLGLRTARRRAHTLRSWLERFQREAGAEWRRQRSASGAAPGPQRRTGPARGPAQEPDDQAWDDEAAKGALRFLLGMPLKLEGERKLLVHFRHERNPEVRRRFLRECERRGPLRCQGCGFIPDARYGTEFSRVLEVHHVLRLGLGVRETRPDHLALLCPTCHRVVHYRREEPLRVEELRALIEAEARGRGSAAVLSTARR
jgi:hypothetical protein